MPKVKVPRKSTNIDMTAMCDVAFLLLSFFILTTKFKPDEALTVVTPSSVSNKIAQTEDVVLITIDAEGKVYLSVSDNNTEQKRAMIDAVATAKGLSLSDAQKRNFIKAGSYVGVPFSKLPSMLSMNGDQLKGVKMEGIPVTDTLNNELITWMTAAKSAFEGKKLELQVKGDAASKYPSFHGVIDAFKKNDLMKFQMVTNPENVPAGSELSKQRRAAPAE